jgi:hypothetical protein
VIFIGNWQEEKKLAPVAGFDLLLDAKLSSSSCSMPERK